MDMIGWTGECKAKETRTVECEVGGSVKTESHPFRLKILVEVKDLSNVWLLCFSDLQVEHQYLSLLHRKNSGLD